MRDNVKHWQRIELDDGTLTYANTDSVDAYGVLHVRHKASGGNISDVVEVNVEEGWLVRAKTDDEGKPWVCPGNPPCGKCNGRPDDHVAYEKLQGNFVIERDG